MTALSDDKLGLLLARLLAATRSFAYVAERDPETGLLTHFEIAQPERAQALLPLSLETSYGAAFHAAILPDDLQARHATFRHRDVRFQNRFRCRDQRGIVHTIHEEASAEGNQVIGILSILPSAETIVFPTPEPAPTSNPRLLRRRISNITAADIESALAQNQFTLAYQFQVIPTQHRLVSAEVFLRWRHPQQGLLFPAKFLSVAEEANLMGAVGHWTASAAAAQQALWATADVHLPLALNLSTRQLLDPQFAQSLPDATLLLEFPESALTHPTSLKPGLRALAERGFHIGIDNAGLEPLDSAQLASLPLGYLKLARSLVQDLEAPESSQKAHRLLELGRACKLTVIADGVETPQQAQWLQKEGCQLQQGYLYSRPLAAEALDEILRSGSYRLPESPYKKAA
ncbi:EAL domain-containing protein [Armatimonas sp.]|uniref:EAL domain-containing protein n=1 Tax=Armatimonas sp. TaxID=1872638 RepID=UPI003752AF2B